MHRLAAGAIAFVLCIHAAPALAVEQSLLREKIAALEPRVIEWRRDLHAHPELGNREFRTSALVALRADMDALPVTEQTGLPFASQVTVEYEGQQTGVMHACGHDAHVAILMGVAELLAGMRDELTGSVLFIFQPAEEGPPEGEEGGAELMLKQGLFEWRKPDAVFGLHVWSPVTAGHIGYRAGPAMAASDSFRIKVTGRQTHGSRPWGGIDPVVPAAQIVLGLQTIASRQVDISRVPAVISVGSIHGGIRSNIIPDDVTLVGTIRTFDEGIRDDIHARVEHTAAHMASSSGAHADVHIDRGYPVTANDPELVAASLPSLRRVVGEDRLLEMPLVTGAEDFSYFANEVPGFFFFLGATPAGVDAATAPSNHSPLFDTDESTLSVGVEALATVALDFLGR